jgi:hypothetical protein
MDDFVHRHRDLPAPLGDPIELDDFEDFSQSALRSKYCACKLSAAPRGNVEASNRTLCSPERAKPRRAALVPATSDE